MTTRLPAWVAICAVLTVQIRLTRADGPDPDTQDRRQVAVIDLTQDDKVALLSGEIYATINTSLTDVLMIPNKRGYDPFLTGKLSDEDFDLIDQARKYATTAQLDIDEAKAADATAQARRGEASLARVVPTPKTSALYAQLSLLVGLAAVDEGRSQRATYAFALTHRIDPSLQLDPVRYPPDTITAFKKASEATFAKVTVQIRGNGRVWIDGVERGPANSTFDVDVGEHVITVAGSDRETYAVMPLAPDTTPADKTPDNDKLVTITAPITIDVPDQPASDVVRIQRLRLALSRAQATGDDVGRAGAMQQLAAILGIHDAVMISRRADGKIQFETWRDRAPGFSAPTLYTTQTPEIILEGITPARKPPPSFRGNNPPPFKPIIPEEQRWYDKGWVQVSGAGAVILIIVGSVLLASRDRPINFNGDVKSGE